MGLLAPRLATTSTFDPSTISGLKAWFKADALALSDAAPVASWTDSSATAQAATAAGAVRPTFKTAIQNGLPIVRFAAGQHLETAALIWSTWFGASDTAVFIVAKANSTGDNDVLFDYPSDGANLLALYAPFFGAFYWDFKTNTTGRINGGSVTGLNAFHLLYGAVAGTTASEVRKDGSSVVSGTLTSAALSGAGTSPLRIGGSNSYLGDIAEVLIYNVTLTATQRQNVEYYLSSKWGTPACGVNGGVSTAEGQIVTGRQQAIGRAALN